MQPIEEPFIPPSKEDSAALFGAPKKKTSSATATPRSESSSTSSPKPGLLSFFVSTMKLR
jgi:hypothetical protein